MDFLIYIDNHYPLGFILWNFFLLLIPFFLYFLLRRYKEQTGLKKLNQKLIAVLVGLLWLLFLPNAAYIILDVRHYFNDCFNNYYKICPKKNWQILFFFTYASLGWLAYVYLLNLMKAIIASIINSKLTNYFIPVIIPLMSLGILLGLNNRLNSWDIFVKPKFVLTEALGYFNDFSSFKSLILFSFLFYILYYLGNYFFKKI